MKTSLTYGIMPTWKDFETAFWNECRDGKYSISLSNSDSRAVDGFKLGDGVWNARNLYDACVEIMASEGDAGQDIVSAILDTLGFEWI